MDIRTHKVARAAYERVERVAAHSGDQHKKKYGALAHKLPNMILNNGLAQATGFLLAKGQPEHCDLLNDLNAVLRVTNTSTADDGPALHQRVIDSDLRSALLLTRRSLEASGWLKRYVQGVLRVNATGESSAQSANVIGNDQQEEAA